MKRLNLSKGELQQQVLRAIFNVVGCNNDDHVKNIAYLMSQNGEWHLSPAFDVIYAYNPNRAWTGQHQMSINGKFDNFTRQDFHKLAELAGLKANTTNSMINMVCEVFKNWRDVAGNEAHIEEKTIANIESTFFKL
jgi:serine/threonine-protein kinase HipA